MTLGVNMFGRILLVAGASLLLCGCVANVPMTRQAPEPEYTASSSVAVAVVDERQKVKDGKKPTFIGVAHGVFGIPADWHIRPVLAVEAGDKNRNLSQFLEHRISSGLTAKGWNAVEAHLENSPSEQEVAGLLESKGVDSLLLFRVREWFFSINLNWVSAFNFDTDTLVEIYRSGKGLVLQKVFAGRDVIDEEASQSPRNHILLAYKAQLDEIVNDPEVRNALLDQVAPSATQ